MRHAALITVLTAYLLASPASTLENIWSFLATAWGATSVDSGCGLDPDGRCEPAPAANEGCGLDPYGRCQPAPTIDEGCGLDPDGRPNCQQGS